MLLPLLLLISTLPSIILSGQHFFPNANGKSGKPLKVLVYSPSLSWSHQKFLGRIADTLAEAGHQVHFLKILSNPSADGNETRLVQRVIRLRPSSAAAADRLDLSKQMESVREPFSGNHFHTLTMYDQNDRTVRELTKVWTQACREIVQNDLLLAQLSSEHYDIAIAEFYDTCPFAFFHRIGVRTKLGAMALPLVQGTARFFGIPTFSSFVPNLSATVVSGPNMNFWERAINFYNELYDWSTMEKAIIDAQTPVVEAAFGPGFLPLREHAKNVSMLFVNSNPFLDFARPISNKIVYIGGIADEQEAEEKQEQLDSRSLDVLEDASKRGAVLVSFGQLSDTQKMGAHMSRALLAAFAHFPRYNFIWKLNGGLPALLNTTGRETAIPPNVHPFNWVKQTALLRHPRLLAFVSHCGLNSLNEAARSGVPLVAVPLFADQLYNAVLAKSKGMAVYVDVKRLNEAGAADLMVEALDKILHDPSHRANARLISQKLLSAPFSPQELLTRWVQFAAQFPELNDLNLPGEGDMSLLAYYSLDVILASSLVLGGLLLAAGLLASKLLGLGRRTLASSSLVQSQLAMLVRNKEKDS